MAKDKEKLKKAEEIVAMQIKPLPPGTDEGGDVIEVKDPRVELTRERIMMALGIPPYEAVITQTTNWDHPIQALLFTKDITELNFLRALGLPKDIYETLKGISTKSPDGKITISNTGFTGMARARQGIVYPGDSGFDFHTKTQILNPQPKAIQDKSKEKGWLAKLNPFGSGE